MTVNMAKWKAIPFEQQELCLDIVLDCGQSFRWRKNTAGEWLGVLSGRVWRLKQDDTHLYYQVYEKEAPLAQGKTETESLPEEGDTKHHATDAQRGQPLPDDLPPLESLKVKAEKVDPSYESPPDPATEEPPEEEDGKVPHIKTEQPDTDADFLRNYFRLDEDVGARYQEFSAADEHFREVVGKFRGVRMLRQDPVENLFAIISSTNHRVKETCTIVENMCREYGERVAQVDGEIHHSFPSPAALAKSGVEELEELGFGYRARFIVRSAKYIKEKGGEKWVTSLQSLLYEEAREELQQLHGVGPKVADCVCLMSLDMPEAVPVDTHVKQIAAEHYGNYLPNLTTDNTVTNKEYQEIADFFRDRWGKYAGWAQSVLFAAELEHLQSKKTSPAETS